MIDKIKGAAVVSGAPLQNLSLTAANPTTLAQPNQTPKLIVIAGAPKSHVVTRLALTDADAEILLGDDFGAIALVAARLLREAGGEEGEQ